MISYRAMDIRPRQQILTLIAIALTFASGANDVASFTRLGGVFTSVMTGNIVLWGLSAAQRSVSLFSHTAVSISGYIIGVAGGTWVAHGFKVRGDGTMIRDVVHVDDIVQGTLAAWRSGYSGPLILGAGRSVTVNEMVTIARQVTGAPIPAENVPVPPGEMPAVVLDISAARAIGYEPAHTLEAGMATVWPDFAPEGVQS